MSASYLPLAHVKPSDVLLFLGTEYKVRSIIVCSSKIEVVFHGVNEEQPYTYEPDERVWRLDTTKEN